jgi:hypothetical protein
MVQPPKATSGVLSLLSFFYLISQRIQGVARSSPQLGRQAADIGLDLTEQLDALFGLRRFSKVSVLRPTRWPGAALVEAGVLERRRYSVRPTWSECRPTQRGRDSRAVLIALLAFANRHFALGCSVTTWTLGFAPD